MGGISTGKRGRQYEMITQSQQTQYRVKWHKSLQEAWSDKCHDAKGIASPGGITGSMVNMCSVYMWSVSRRIATNEKVWPNTGWFSIEIPILIFLLSIISKIQLLLIFPSEPVCLRCWHPVSRHSRYLTGLLKYLMPHQPAFNDSCTSYIIRQWD